MAVLPILGALGGAALTGTATGAVLGAVGGTLLGGMMGGKEKSLSSPTPTTPTPSAATPMPSLLAPSASAAPGGTHPGAGMEEPNPIEAKKVSMQAQQRRHGRRSTILTDQPSEENEYLGGP